MASGARKRQEPTWDPLDGLDIVSFDLVLGRALRRIRSERGMSQHDLAVKASDGGVPWTRVVVTKVENGTRSVQLLEFFLLARALDVHPEVLLTGLGPTEKVELSPTAWADAEGLRALIDPSLTGGHVSTPRTRMLTALAEGALDMFAGYGNFWPGATAGQLLAALDDAGLAAESKAAADVDIDPIALSVLAHRRWGHGFTTERDRRVEMLAATGAPEMGKRVLMGHAARRLLEELAPDIDEAKKIVTKGGSK